MENLGLLLCEATCKESALESDSPSAHTSTVTLSVAITRQSKAFSQYIDIPTILPILRAKSLLTGEEFTHLLTRWEKGLRDTTACLMLELLPRKTPEWALLLYEALEQESEHRGHQYLVELLKRSSEERSETGTAYTLANHERSEFCSCCQKCQEEIRRLKRENARLKMKSPFKCLMKN